MQVFWERKLHREGWTGEASTKVGTLVMTMIMMMMMMTMMMCVSGKHLQLSLQCCQHHSSAEAPDLLHHLK
jgi:hypothetical protein